MAVTIIENFEDGVSVFDAGDTSTFFIATDGGFAGSNYLRRTQAGNSHRGIRASSVTWDNATTETLRAYLRADAGGTNLAALRFGAQTSSYNGYGAYIDTRNGSSGTAGFQLRLDNGTSPLAWQSVTITPGTWYRVEVDWRNTSPRITARLYEGDGATVLAEITSDDTTYSTGEVGLHSFNQASFDEVAFIGAGGGPPAPVTGTGAATAAMSLSGAVAAAGALAIAAVTGVAICSAPALVLGAAASGAGVHAPPGVTGTGAAVAPSISLSATASGTGAFQAAGGGQIEPYALATYNFGNSANRAAPSDVATGFTFSDFVRVGMGTNEISDVYGYDSGHVLRVGSFSNTPALAKANDRYIGLTVTPDAASDFTNLSFKTARGGSSSPRGFYIYSSVDGFTSSLGGEMHVPTERTTWTQYSFDFNLSGITEPVEFRIFVHTPSTGSTLEFDDFILTGREAGAGGGSPDPVTGSAAASAALTLSVTSDGAGALAINPVAGTGQASAALSLAATSDASGAFAIGPVVGEGQATAALSLSAAASVSGAYIAGGVTGTAHAIAPALTLGGAVAGAGAHQIGAVAGEASVSASLVLSGGSSAAGEFVFQPVTGAGQAQAALTLSGTAAGLGAYTAFEIFPASLSFVVAAEQTVLAVPSEQVGFDVTAERTVFAIAAEQTVFTVTAEQTVFTVTPEVAL